MPYLATAVLEINLEGTLRDYSHRASALTLALMLEMHEKNALVSIVPFTPNISININSSIKIQMGPGSIHNRQR